VNYYRYHSGTNLFGQSIKSVHFGLGSHQTVQEVQVSWPNGLIESFDQFQANQLVNLMEGAGREVSEDIILAVDSNINDWLVVYPNPVRFHVWLQFQNDRPGSVKFSLMDLVGNLLFSQALDLSVNGRVKIDLSSAVSSGAYLYQISGDGHELRGKIIKW
jgi:hypothetical protein